jgi:serine/threonine protein kinase
VKRADRVAKVDEPAAEEAKVPANTEAAAAAAAATFAAPISGAEVMGVPAKKIFAAAQSSPTARACCGAKRSPTKASTRFARVEAAVATGTLDVPGGGFDPALLLAPPSPLGCSISVLSERCGADEFSQAEVAARTSVSAGSLSPLLCPSVLTFQPMAGGGKKSLSPSRGSGNGTGDSGLPLTPLPGCSRPKNTPLRKKKTALTPVRFLAPASESPPPRGGGNGTGVPLPPAPQPLLPPQLWSQGCSISAGADEFSQRPVELNNLITSPRDVKRTNDPGSEIADGVGGMGGAKGGGGGGSSGVAGQKKSQSPLLVLPAPPHLDFGDAGTKHEPAATPGRKKVMCMKVPKKMKEQIVTTPPLAQGSKASFLTNAESVIFAAPNGTPGTVRKGLSHSAVNKRLAETNDEHGRTFEPNIVMKALTAGVELGRLVEDKGSYKLSPEATKEFERGVASSIGSTAAVTGPGKSSTTGRAASSAAAGTTPPMKPWEWQCPACTIVNEGSVCSMCIRKETPGGSIRRTARRGDCEAAVARHRAEVAQFSQSLKNMKSRRAEEEGGGGSDPLTQGLNVERYNELMELSRARHATTGSSGAGGAESALLTPEGYQKAKALVALEQLDRDNAKQRGVSYTQYLQSKPLLIKGGLPPRGFNWAEYAASQAAGVDLGMERKGSGQGVGVGVGAGATGDANAASGKPAVVAAAPESGSSSGVAEPMAQAQEKQPRTENVPAHAAPAGFDFKFNVGTKDTALPVLGKATEFNFNFGARPTDAVAPVLGTASSLPTFSFSGGVVEPADSIPDESHGLARALESCAEQISALQRQVWELAKQALLLTHDDGAATVASTVLAEIAAQSVFVQESQATKGSLIGALATTAVSGSMQQRAAAVLAAERCNSLQLVDTPIPQDAVAATKASMQGDVLLSAFAACPEDRSSAMMAYRSIHNLPLPGGCMRLRELMQVEMAIGAASAILEFATVGNVSEALQNATAAGLPDATPEVVRGTKVLDLLIRRRDAGLRVVDLVASVQKHVTAAEPVISPVIAVQRAEQVLALAVSKLREGLDGETRTLVDSRNDARRILIQAMEKLQIELDLVNAKDIGFISIQGKLQVALDDLAIMLRDVAPQIEHDTSQLFAVGTDAAAKVAEMADDLATCYKRQSLQNVAHGLALEVQVAIAQREAATAGEVLDRTREAIIVTERCKTELPYLQGLEASPPDTETLREAQFAVDDKMIELRTARDRLTTAQRQKRAGATLDELQVALDAANSNKRDAVAALDVLRDAALGSIAHFVELTSIVLAADVPEGLMLLWQPNRQLCDFEFEPISGGRHSIFKIALDNGSFAVLKEYPCVGGMRKHFIREAQALHQLKHPCIMPLQAIFSDGERNSFFLQVPFCPGGPLDVFIQRALTEGSLDGSGVRLLLQRALHGVEFLHTKGVVHSDIKPGNILVGKAGVPYITDFETSRQAGSEAATISTGGGSLGFIAPELHGFDASPTEQSDMFAFGRTLMAVQAAMNGAGFGQAGDKEDAGGALLVALMCSSMGSLGDLVSRLTQADPSARLTAAQALQHPYFTTEANLQMQAQRNRLVDGQLEVEQQRTDLASQEASNAQLRQLQQYEWLDEHGVWNQYPAEINQIIATASAGGDKYSEFEVAGNKYSVTSVFPMFQTGQRSGTHRHVRLADGSAVEAHLRQAPAYWRPGTAASASELVALDRDSSSATKAAWDDVVARVKMTVPAARVLGVSVLQDPLRWKAYHTNKCGLDDRLRGGANEQRVFHAGGEDDCSNIATNGFLREYNTVSVFGKVLYIFCMRRCCVL